MSPCPLHVIFSNLQILNKTCGWLILKLASKECSPPGGEGVIWKWQLPMNIPGSSLLSVNSTMNFSLHRKVLLELLLHPWMVCPPSWIHTIMLKLLLTWFCLAGLWPVCNTFITAGLHCQLSLSTSIVIVTQLTGIFLSQKRFNRYSTLYTQGST